MFRLLFLALAVLTSELLAADEPRDMPPDDKSEVHVVGIYEGYTRSGGKIHGGRAEVEVKRPGKSVTLVLTAYDPTKWILKVDQGTEIKKVILGGYHKQALAEIPDGCELINAFYEGGARPYLPALYNMENARFRPFVSAVHKMTNQEIRSFQGAYRSDPGKPYVVDRVQDDEKLLSGYPFPTKASELPELTFTAIHFALLERHDVQSSIGEFTLQGPNVETLKPLPPGVRRVVQDPDTKKFYGLSTHDFVEVDLAKKLAEKIEVSLDVPRLSWPTGLAFDTKRKRVLISNRSLIYAFTPSSGEWLALAEIGRRDGLSAIAYEPTGDVIYGLGSRFGDEQHASYLHAYNSEGALLKSTRLGDPVVPAAFGGDMPLGPAPQIIPVGGQLILLGISGDHETETADRMTLMYLFDPKSEKSKLTWKE